MRNSLRRGSLGAVILLSVTACGGSSKDQGSKNPASSSSTPQSLTGKNAESPIRYNYGPGELTKACDEAVKKVTERLDAVAKRTNKGAESPLLAFENAVADFTDESSPYTFMKEVSTDDKVREESAACDEKISQYFVDIFTRKDLYLAVKDSKAANADEARLLSETIKGFEMNGLKLSDEKLNQVRELMRQLSSLSSKFGTNINEDKTEVEFTAQDLDGVPETVLARFKKNPDGKYLVPTKSSEYVPVMENSKNGETRHRMMMAYYDRATPANVKILEDVLALRRQIAGIMGYKTWADYKTSNGRMAKSGKEVMSFLNDLKGKLAQAAKRDLSKMVEYKKQLEPNDPTFHQWDVAYYTYQLKKRDFSLDDEKIREYFPADKVIAGMFSVYSKLLGVHFEPVEAKTWAADVKLYRIVDDKKPGETVAYFYTDFFPRPGKYSHAAAFSLISGRRQADGSYSKPVSAIVANFTAPAAGRPSLLVHDEVETIFHEFGHIMHQTLTRAPYASLSGTSVERDFVEAPSQMLEEWVWKPEILSLVSGHYQRPDEKLPADLLKSMIAARDFNQGIFYTRQLFYGLLDMTYHTSTTAIDTTAVLDKLHKEVTGIESPGAHFQASFGHLMGYDAGYYGYLWSEVYAADMFTRFEKGGLMSSEVGADYRKNILEPGNMQDALDHVTAFLGRKPNNEAFFKKLGISTTSSRRRR